MRVEKLLTDHIDIWSSALQTRSTAGRGSSGKIDLYGIKKLRELILELAVRGKLVPQDPNDEPASELLKRIAAEKAELVKQGKIKKQKPLPEISEEEKPFELPEGWEWVRLGTVVNVFNGNSISASEKEKKYFKKEGRPFIATKDVGYGFDELDYENGIAIPHGIDTFKVAKKGAVLICAEGGSAGKKCGISNQEICFGNKLFANECYIGIESVYILCNFLSPSFFAQFVSNMTGIIGGISTSKFNELLIPLAPEQEQRKIIFRVKELISICDQLEQQSLISLDAHQQLVETLLATLTDSQNAEELAENWARVSQHFDTLFTTEASIDALKQTILQLAVMGLLIENPEFRYRRSLKNYLSFGPRNGLSPIEVKYKTDIKVLKLGATSYGYLNLQETKWVNIDINDKPHLRLKKNDILIQRGNSSNFVGCSLLIEKDFNNLIYPDLMMKIRTRDELLPEYTVLWLSSPFARKYMWSNMTGTSGTMPKISKKVVEELPIAVPDLVVQHQLVIKTKELFLLCDQIKSRLQSAQQTQLHLADALTDAALN
ncbi:restriction endonuclease subunit S [Cronobacter sakazakii]|uniref:restriction endonuclease subunit S n=1 Tax=Cronobacter sakazakii TaxID=28141 RepID=UPI000CFAC581|nr:restriction endonuclease subunit S [Cronobacter sakazakii]ELY7523471.1 restriction endonuclease subunit S [Cronobacter sakazakii]ELZ1659954.1 restriction endonuclease subunit S [Cronobacter sakazakii]UWT88479.1 restriction endonuclease subunit S [Cronobacter sakazakii]